MQKRETIHPNGERSVVRTLYGRLYGAPAVQEFSADGELIGEYYYNKNGLHRVDGPAIWGRNFEVWFVNGARLTARQLEEKLRPEEFRAVLYSLPQPIFEEIWAEFRTI